MAQLTSRTGTARARRAFHGVLELLESRRLLYGVVSSDFLFESGPQKLAYEFDYNVQNLAEQQHVLTNLSTSTQIGPAHPDDVVLTPSGTFTADFTFPHLPHGALPNGNYESLIDLEPTQDPGLDDVFGFFALGADANHDRSVDELDYDALLNGLNNSLTGFSNGDFNYDGEINGDDLFVFDHNWGDLLPQPPSEANSLIATSAIDDGQIDLQWTPPAGNAARDGYRIFRSTDGGATFTMYHQLEDPDATTWADTGLPEGAKYTYRVRAYTDEDGNSLTTNKYSAVTHLNGPTEFTATNITETSMTLNWQDNSTNEDGFSLTVISGADVWLYEQEMLPAHTGTGLVTFELEGLDPSQSYDCFIQAVTDAAWSSLAPEAVFWTDGPMPTDLAVSYQSDSFLTLDWTDNADNELGFVITCVPSEGDTLTFDVPAQSGTGAMSYAMNGFVPGINYNITVSAILDAQTSSVSQPLGVDIYAGEWPALNIEATSSTSIHLEWYEGPDVNESYHVYRSTDGENFTQVDETTETEWWDDDVEEATTYYYKVLPYNSADGEYESTVVAQVTTPLDAPSELEAITVSTTEIDLEWIDNSDLETGYLVQRSLDGETFSSVAILPADNVSFSDSGLQPDTAYAYRVVATNAGQSSADSNLAATVTIPLAPAAPTNLTTTRINMSRAELSWVHDGTNTDFFAVLRSDNGGDFEQVGVVEADQTLFVDEGLNTGVTYAYKVEAQNGGGATSNSNGSQSVNNAAPPSNPPAPPTWTPSGFTGSATSATQLSLSWTNSVTVHVQLEQKGPDDENFHVVNSLNASAGPQSLALSGLRPDTSYQFRLRADKDGFVSDSSFSVTTPSATPPSQDPTATLPKPSITNVQIPPLGGGGSVSFTGDYTDGPTAPDGVDAFQTGYADDSYGVRSFHVNGPPGPINGNVEDGFGFGFGTFAGGETLKIRFQAAGPSGHSDYSDWYSFSMPGDPLPAPTLTAQPYGNGMLELSVDWSAFPEALFPDAHVYLVGPDGETATNMDEYAASGLFPVAPEGGSYFATCSDFNFGTSPYSNFVNADGSPTLPATPTNLAATAAGDGTKHTVRLVWDNTANNETGFEIQRATDLEFSVRAKTFDVAEDKSSYEDTVPSDEIGVGYFYRVRAKNAAGNSAWSNVAGTSGGPIIVGFYGAEHHMTRLDTQGNPVDADGNPLGDNDHLNDGNIEMHKIGQRLQGLGFETRLFWATSEARAFDWLLKRLDLNGDGKYDPAHGDQSRSIEIYGHSWGGTSAVVLANDIRTSAKFEDHTVAKLATIDPVRFGRFTSANVGQNVLQFRNWFVGKTPVGATSILGVPVHGRELHSASQDSNHGEQVNMNDNGLRKTSKFRPPDLYFIDHFTIVSAAADSVVDFLK